MQKKRIVITLDPDYIPWEAPEDIFKLRRKRLHIPKWLIGVVAVVVMLTVAVVSKARQGMPEIVTDAPAAVQIVNPYQGWCEYGGNLLSQGVHHIGGTDRVCQDGTLQ